VAPPSTRTGANPRGVAISGPRAPSGRPTVNDRSATTLYTGANPRGVAIAGPRATPKTPTVNDKKAVGDVFKLQSPKQQAAILKGLKGADPWVAKAVNGALATLPADHKDAILHELAVARGGTDIWGDIGGALGGAAKDVYSLLPNANPLKGAYKQQTPTAGKLLAGGAAAGLTGLANISAKATAGPTGLGTHGISTAGVGGGALPQILLKAPADIAKATVQDPSVIPKTIKGLGETAIGSAAALAELPVKAVQEGPLKAGKQIVKAAAKDYSSRYGPLVSGNDKAFIARIKKEGAGSEALDALGFAGGADATLGRIVSGAARTGEELGQGGRLIRALTAERPALKISGNEVRRQELAGTAGRAMAQRLEDKLRKARGSGQVETKAGEVRPITRIHNYDMQMRKLISGIAARHRYLMQQSINREVRHGAEPEFRKLSSAEQKAATHVLEGTVRLRSGPKAAQADIRRMMDNIIAERARNHLSPGNRIASKIADKVDNLQQLDQLHGSTEKWLTPKLADWQAREAARSARVDEALPDSFLHQSSAEARRLRSQGEFFGVAHPDELHDQAERAGSALDQHALRDAPGTIRDAHREVERVTAKLAKARQREAVALARLRAGKGLPKIPGHAEAKRAEARAGAVVRERTAQLAQAQKREAEALARQGGIRGPYRGRTDITGKPLPAGVYEGIDRAQRRRALAEERLRAAKVNRGQRIQERVELGKMNRHELPLEPHEAERIFSRQRETAHLEDALAHAKREHASAKEYGAYAKEQAAHGRQDRLHEYLANKEEHLRQYSARVRDLAQAHGLPEPAFMHHNPLPKEDFTARTLGSGQGAQSPPKHTTYKQYRGGAVDRSPEAYFGSVARAIRAAHQWRHVDEQFRRNALPSPSASAIHEALGEDKHPTDLTGHELSQVMLHQGTDLHNIRFYNPGRLAESTLEEHGLVKGSRAGTQPHELETSGQLHDALNDPSRSMDGAKVDSLRPDEPFLRTTGWKALPRGAYDEIHSGLRPSGTPGRLVGKAQGLAAAGILGLSPSFVIMNSLAHLYLATAGTRGRILSDSLKFPLWWHGLSEEEKNIVRSHAGGRGDYHLQKMGSTAQGKLRSSWNDLKGKGIMRVIGHANPVRALFKAEDMQSNFFRHMTYYSAAKRQALRNITTDMGPAASAAARLDHALNVGPKDEMARLLQSQPAAEELGRYTVNMMGDYARFTSGERKWLNNRGVLFYSFLRHATRTLLHVLPVKHPIATALVGELGKLHNDEVKKMLGGADLPYAMSRLYFHHGNGKLSSIDLARSSPIGSLATDVATEGFKGLAKGISPALQPVIDAIYGSTPTGQKINANAFQVLSEYLGLSYPYRLAKDLRFGTKPQTPESIPLLHERAYKPKSKSAQQYALAKAQAAGPEQQKLLAGLLGLYPKPDDIREIAAHQPAIVKAAAKARKASGGSGFFEPPSSGAAKAPSSSGFFAPSTSSKPKAGSGFFQ
jgi:hypothetical protein